MGLRQATAVSSVVTQGRPEWSKATFYPCCASQRHSSSDAVVGLKTSRRCFLWHSYGLSGLKAPHDIYIKNDGDIINGNFGIQSDNDMFGFLNIGNNCKTQLMSFTYNRTFLHIVSGSVKIYLYNPKELKNMYFFN